MPEAGVLAVDARGHGGSVVRKLGSKSGDRMGKVEELDLSLETLAEDLVEMVLLVQARTEWKELPGMVLVGHSLGGAVVVEVAKGAKLGSKVLAYAVLDVVEGSAIDALQSMQSYLSTRPKTFPSVEAGIDWQYVLLPLVLVPHPFVPFEISFLHCLELVLVYYLPAQYRHL